ncbi:MAG: hypothetical protein HY238_05235 [Acidobacteria bacterium]|nr:hypothetical protein [Acidobacteriota bacterium]
MKLAILTLLIGLPLAGENPKPAENPQPKASAKRVVETPFGPSLRGAPAPRRPADHSLVKVEERGDVVIFRRQTPFGDQVWQRRRAELTPVEKEMIAAQDRPAGPAAQR